MRKIIYDNLHKIIALLCVVVICIVLLSGGTAGMAVAYAESSYTDVLTDLQTDESFNVSDYPADSSDYSLSVIQIAESENNELFLYVYRPYTGSAYDITATSINISTTVGEDNLYYKNYSLTLLSQSGVFGKYVVNNFTVKSSTVRYYDISSIYRTYYTAIDGEEVGDNTTSEVAYAVGQCWAAGEVDGVTYYDMEETTVVEVTAYAGFIRYFSTSYFVSLGVGISYEYFDSHFIAFDCDYDIDELYEADISFYLQSKDVLTFKAGDYDGESGTVVYGEIDTTYYDNPLQIDSGDVSSYESLGVLGMLGKTTYSWDRICTVSDFIENLDSDDCYYNNDFLDTIYNYQWVVRFYETEFKRTTYSSAFTATEYEYISTEVTDVTILRLKFLSEGTVYNLGVVCNKITEGDDPGGSIGGGLGDSCESIDWKTILSILLLVILVIILFPVLPYIAKVFVLVISLPFKLISAIVQAFKKPKGNDKNKKE